MQPGEPAIRRTSYLIAALVTAMLALAPGLANARAGGGMSMGSRGMRTFSVPRATPTAPHSGAPMQRSFSQPAAPSYAPSPGLGYGYRTHSPFMSGLLGGLIGAGIGGLLFGHSLFGGIHGVFGFLGFLLQVFIIVAIVRWLWRRFAGPQPAFAGVPSMFARGFGPVPMGAGNPRPAGGPPLAIGSSDYQAFEQTLKQVQAAWSAHDTAALQRLATPEMMSYFAEQLAAQESRGVRNIVSDVRLDKGDLSEAWSEGSREYATVAMRFSMTDVTQDAHGRIVGGSPAERVSAAELWTFMRAPGGRWLLSAIQQAR
jgi:predicted lipid-binding transport protein (Tim44 family)